MSGGNDSTARRIKARARRYRARKNIVILGALVPLVYFAVVFGNLHYRNYVLMERSLRDAKRQYSERVTRIENLKQEKIKLRDPDYVARIAREELYFMEPDEVHIQIPPALIERLEPRQKRGTRK